MTRWHTRHRTFDSHNKAAKSHGHGLPSWPDICPQGYNGNDEQWIETLLSKHGFAGRQVVTTLQNGLKDDYEHWDV